MEQLDDLPELDMPTRLSSPGELVSLVPYLLGFHPTSSVVVLAFVESRLVVTARFGVEFCERPDILDQHLARITERFPDARYVLAGYAETRTLGDEALSMVEFLLGADRIIDSLYVTADRYWSRMCTTPGCCPPEGRRYDLQTSAAAVRAVVSGLQAVPRRADLAKRVQSPRGGAAQAARRNIDDAHAATRTLSDDELVATTDTLLDSGLAQAEELEPRELAMLSVLMDRPELRDRALRRLTREDCQAHLRLWERLVRATPRAEQGPALGLMGLAAWVNGDGALQSICLERAEQSGLCHPLLSIVSDIQQMAAPPALWQQLRRGLFNDFVDSSWSAGQ